MYSNLQSCNKVLLFYVPKDLLRPQSVEIMGNGKTHVIVEDTELGTSTSKIYEYHKLPKSSLKVICIRNKKTKKIDILPTLTTIQQTLD